MWELQWHPSFEVALVEASARGTTIESAATATLTDAAAATADPGDVAALVEEALLAELPGALATVMATLADRAAQQRDTVRLMAAVEPLARTRRYGNVRRVDTDAVAPVLAGVLTRVAVGLPAAVAAHRRRRCGRGARASSTPSTGPSACSTTRRCAGHGWRR